MAPGDGFEDLGAEAQAGSGGETRLRLLERKSIHVAVIAGLALVALLLPRWQALALTGGAFALFAGFALLSRRSHAAAVEEVAEELSREDKDIPAQGITLALAGAVVVVALARPEVAAAALLILALGDSAPALYLEQFGGHGRLPWSDRAPDVFLVGVLAGGLAAALVAPWWATLPAAAVALLPNTLDARLPAVADDNLLIPVVAAAVITAITFAA